MFTPDRAAHCAVKVQDVTDETISIVGDIMYAVCQLNTPVDSSLTMSPDCDKTASIEVNYDGVSDTIITAAAEGGDPVESVIVVPRRRASPKTRARPSLTGMVRRTKKDRGD
ncbi:hypothetical protein MHU86_22394 [Fragilaria crotonensis]|nr:hypothetical protein MHU86_22394 [Fragilaria crotonensis]